MYWKWLGVQYSTVKILHLLLATGAVVAATLGVYDMWLVHEAGAAGQISKGWAVHFQSVHSWIGMIVVAIFAWQWLGGLVLFFTDADISQKGTHAVLGAFAIFGGFLSIITGILTLAFRGDNVADKDYTFKMIAVLTFLLAAAVALVFSSPLP